MPWHWAQANWPKSCAPAATLALTFDGAGVVEPPDGVVRTTVVVREEVLERPPSHAVTATATITNTIAVTARTTVPTPVVPPVSRSLDMTRRLGRARGSNKGADYESAAWKLRT